MRRYYFLSVPKNVIYIQFVHHGHNGQKIFLCSAPLSGADDRSMRVVVTESRSRVTVKMAGRDVAGRESGHLWTSTIKQKEDNDLLLQ
jgi:hypothetical protein